MPLRLCERCNRHVAASGACPFCGAAARVCRAALVAALAAGCQSHETIVQPYGAPPTPTPDDAAPTTTPSPTADAGK